MEKKTWITGETITADGLNRTAGYSVVTETVQIIPEQTVTVNDQYNALEGVYGEYKGKLTVVLDGVTYRDVMPEENITEPYYKLTDGYDIDYFGDTWELVSSSTGGSHTVSAFGVIEQVDITDDFIKARGYSANYEEVGTLSGWTGTIGEGETTLDGGEFQHSSTLAPAYIITEGTIGEDAFTDIKMVLDTISDNDATFVSVTPGFPFSVTITSDYSVVKITPMGLDTGTNVNLSAHIFALNTFISDEFEKAVKSLTDSGSPFTMIELSSTQTPTSITLTSEEEDALRNAVAAISDTHKIPVLNISITSAMVPFNELYIYGSRDYSANSYSFVGGNRVAVFQNHVLTISDMASSESGYWTTTAQSVKYIRSGNLVIARVEDVTKSSLYYNSDYLNIPYGYRPQNMHIGDIVPIINTTQNKLAGYLEVKSDTFLPHWFTGDVVNTDKVSFTVKYNALAAKPN